MNRCICVISAAWVALTCSALASAQTTRPAGPPATWSATVQQLARATEKADVPLVTATLSRDASLRSFETTDQAAARSLVDAAADWKLLGTHAYEFPPASLAVDIAADVKGSDLVPEAEKRKIIPLDDAEAARANTTAADWVAQTLAADRNQLVGVAVFWHIRTNRPMFVLMKGQPAGETFTVRTAVYGDPMVRRTQAAAK
jgi:hypothetical protein